MLQDAGVPAAGLDHDGRPPVVERLDARGASTGHDRLETVDAQASLEEIDRLRAQRETRVGDDVEGDRRALGRVVLADVLDDRQLQRQADLRRRQAHAGRLVHRVAHQLDELLDLVAGDLGGGERAGGLAEDRVPRLDDLELHRASLPKHRARVEDQWQVVLKDGSRDITADE